MRVPNLVPIGPQAATCIRPEGYTHTHTLSYIDIDVWHSRRNSEFVDGRPIVLNFLIPFCYNIIVHIMCRKRGGQKTVHEH